MTTRIKGFENIYSMREFFEKALFHWFIAS